MAKRENYMDQDMAYFLGLFQSRGMAHQISGGLHKIEISFPTKSLIMEGHDQKSMIAIGVSMITELQGS